MKVIYIVILIYLQIDGMYRLYKNARSRNKNIQLLFLIASVINDGRKDNTLRFQISYMKIGPLSKYLNVKVQYFMLICMFMQIKLFKKFYN